MTASTLHDVHDPLCGWCCAAAPLVQAVMRTGLILVPRGGGLWDPATTMGRDRSADIRQHDARIAALTGLPFGPAYMDGVLGDPGTVLWSRPTIAAVLAAGEVEAGAGMNMLHAIQDAHDVSGRRVVDEPVLVDLARGSGFSGFALEWGAELVRVPHEPFHGQPGAFVRSVGELTERLGAA